MSVKDLFQRKAEMIFHADAAIVLPGGIGTLDELLEVAAGNDYNVYSKEEAPVIPIILLNTEGFYDGMKLQFDTCVRHGFVDPKRLDFFYMADTAEATLELLNNLDAQGPHKAGEYTSYKQATPSTGPV